MPTFIPPYLGEEIKSNAERKMYDVLQDLQLKNAYVLHSLGLPKHQSKIYGEIDFVIVCELGVACLEIKGGRVECRDGKWYFTDRHGVEREKSEGPFAQVTGNMFSLRDAIRNRFSNNSHMKNILVASGVVFPDIEFRSKSEEIIPEIIYDNKTDNITDYIKDVFGYWKERQHREPAKLSQADVKELVKYFRADFCYVPTLESRLNDVESKLIRLTNEQVRIMDSLATNDHLLIEGAAGTGKTLLAVDFSKKQAKQGLKVLYLTFNKNLSHNIQKQVGEVENLRIINLHALFGELVPVDLEKLKENPQKYFNEQLPDDVYDYLGSLSAEALRQLQYDLIVMDEGQDILKLIYLYILDNLLEGGFEKGHWAVFYDQKQNIYNPEYDEGMEFLKSYVNTQFRLFVNCRNTVQIGTYSSKLSGVELTEFIRENGEDVQQVSYVDDKDFKKQIQTILKELKKENVDMKDIAFLAPKKYRNSMLGKAGIEVNELNDEFDDSIDLPVYATIQGFKGLDSKVVILTGVDNVWEENFSQYLYIAGTRARTLLYIVGSNDFWEKHNVRGI